jgi:esterase/lipase
MFSYDDSKVELHSKDGWSADLFDDDSKFKGFDPETMRISGKVKYIEDTEKYMNEKKTQFEAVKTAAAKYLEACKEFDAESVKGMADLPHIYIPNYITK